MANAGLFLKALAARGSELPRLLHANLGNQVANAEALSRLAEFATAAPALDDQKLEQIAALPLGSRVKINPWNNQLTLVKTRPHFAALRARENAVRGDPVRPVLDAQPEIRQWLRIHTDSRRLKT